MSNQNVQLLETSRTLQFEGWSQHSRKYGNENVPFQWCFDFMKMPDFLLTVHPHLNATNTLLHLTSGKNIDENHVVAVIQFFHGSNSECLSSAVFSPEFFDRFQQKCGPVVGRIWMFASWVDIHSEAHVYSRI